MNVNKLLFTHDYDKLLFTHDYDKSLFNAWIFDFDKIILYVFFGSSQNSYMLKPVLRSAVSLFFIIPLLEELLFRDYLIMKLDGYQYKNIISSVLFGLIHIPNPFMTLNYTSINDKIIYFLISTPTITYLGYVCALQNNILLSVMIHCVYNIITVYTTAILYSYKNKNVEKIVKKDANKTLNKINSSNMSSIMMANMYASKDKFTDLTEKKVISIRRHSIPKYKNDKKDCFLASTDTTIRDLWKHPLHNKFSDKNFFMYDY
jgi:hypothetical protein